MSIHSAGATVEWIVRINRVCPGIVQREIVFPLNENNDPEMSYRRGYQDGALETFAISCPAIASSGHSPFQTRHFRPGALSRVDLLRRS
jgi:hypothetical protein